MTIRGPPTTPLSREPPNHNHIEENNMPNPPVIERFIVDIVVDEPLSDARRESFAQALSDHAHVLELEPEDQGHPEISDKLTYGHVHDAVNERCSACTEAGRDYRNGQVVLDNEE